MQIKKKLIAGALAAGLVMGAGGIAAAYFTATGTGNGSGSVGHPTTWAVSVANTTSGTLTPGGPSETINFTVTNPSTGNQYLTKVTVTIGTFSSQSTTNLPACTAATFTLTGLGVGPVTFLVKTDMTSGSSYSSHVILRLKNKTTNQDNCQGVTVPIRAHAS